MFSQHDTNPVPKVWCHTKYNLPCEQRKAPLVGKTVYGQTHSNKKTLAIQMEQNFCKTDSGKSLKMSFEGGVASVEGGQPFCRSTVPIKVPPELGSCTI